MLVIGIVNNELSGACLIENERILAAAHEERFTRTKNDSIWPTNSIEYVLSSQAKTLDQVDYVAYGWCAGFDAEQHLLLYVDRIAEEEKEKIPYLKKRIADEIQNDKKKKKEFIDFLKANSLENKAIFIDHHRSHAMGSFVCSPFDNSLVVTCDGRGDFQSLTISLVSNNFCKILHRETSIDSLGYFYGRITKLLGYKPNRHEGKISGLASFGNAKKYLPLMEKMICLKNGSIRASCGDYYQPSYHGYSELLINIIKDANPADVAAAAQQHIENILAQLAQHYINETASKNICLAGGVFSNVRLNQKIRELPGVDNIYVLPCMGDGGLALSAAAVAMFDKNKTRTKIPSMALGPDYNNDEEIISIIKKYYPEIDVSVPIDMQSEIITFLSNNKIIGLFRGRMEFGPRSLCKRSIIYHAHDKEMNNWLNKRLERTEFMPFAPITPENLAHNCYINWKLQDISAHFMTITYDCKEIMKQACPAVVHVDGTARPQVISREGDFFMYELLNKWYQKTGEPSLVNTSFNKREEPIICTPEDGLSSLKDGIIDILCINDRLICQRKE